MPFKTFNMLVTIVGKGFFSEIVQNCRSHASDLWARRVLGSKRSEQQPKKLDWRPCVESTARHNELVSVDWMQTKTRRDFKGWSEMAGDVLRCFNGGTLWRSGCSCTSPLPFYLFKINTPILFWRTRAACSNLANDMIDFFQYLYK